MDKLIRINSISKSFKGKKILHDIDLVIEKGESIAIVGNNGSGKSTFLKIISGLTNIDSGEIIYSHPLKFNYIPEHFPKMNITAKKYIKHIGLIEGLSSEVVEQRSNELFKSFFMEEMVDIPTKHLSKGTLQKVGVVQALLSKPDVLLLDEPLSGQDIDSQKVFIKLVNDLNNQGVTIIMSCHEKFLVNKISNVVYQIRNKTLEPLDFKKIYIEKYDTLIFEINNDNRNINNEIKKMVDKIEEDNSKVKIIHRVQINNGKIKMIVERDKSNEVIRNMLEKGHLLRRMEYE